MKKIIALVLALVLTVAASVAGTVAYLQAEDSDVNVMTLGNVEIEQIEQEYNANGDLVDFTQAKPLYPYVGQFGWKNTETGNGAYRQFTMENVVDKYVSVKNTGKSDAYVRTLIALEMGDYTYDEFDMVGISINSVSGTEFKFGGTWAYDSTKDFVAEIDGKNYYVMEFVHQNPVEPGETTIPSLLQVYLSKDATNETVEKLDGNDNGTYEILALSQAVQTKGFADAQTALDTAFGDVDKENALKWFGGMEAPEVISSYGDYLELYGKDGNYVLGGDLAASDMLYFGTNTDVSLDLNGKTITAENTNQYAFAAPDGATLELNGNGTVNMGKGFFAPSPGGEIIVNGGTYNATVTGTLNNIKHHHLTQNGGRIVINGGTFTSNVSDAVLFFATSNSRIEINGGFFENTATKTPDLLGIGTNKYNTNRIILSGGTFVNWNPLEDQMCYTGKWPEAGESAFGGPWILIMGGYKVVSETQSNGDVWYSVVPE